MTPAELRDSKKLMLMLGKSPFRVLTSSDDYSQSYVHGLVYGKTRGRWKPRQAWNYQLSLPESGDAWAQAARESLSWMHADEGAGRLKFGSEVVRHEADAVFLFSGDQTRFHRKAVYCYDSEINHHPDGIVVDVSKRRGMVQVAWLM